MDEIFSWILAILIILYYSIPQILGNLVTIGTIDSAIWAIIDLKAFKSIDGDIRRGIKISSKLLPEKQKLYLESLSLNVVENGENLLGKEISTFIRKQNEEVIIYAKQSYGFRWRRSWPLVGYVNLATSNPMLEFRSSVPFVLFLLSLALSIFLLPFVIGLGLVGFSMEIQTIEKFLQSKSEFVTS